MTTAPAPEHHPIVRAQSRTPVLQDPEFVVDFLGLRTRVEFVSAMAKESEPVRQPSMVTPGIPSFDEEYFEWIDLLEAAAEATSEFVMVELGAGYGRWLVRGAAAIRQRPDCTFRGIGVEAEPGHFRWLKQHFRDNDIDPATMDLRWAAVSSRVGFVPFWVGTPNEWYGQAVADRAATTALNLQQRRRLKARSVLGRPPVVPSEGQSVIWVPCVSLHELIEPYPRVDLIDLDVQGLELEVLASAIDLLNARVRRVHVGTHSTEIEAGLRVLFEANGWEKLHDYPSQSATDTPYGVITFGDGVQSWRNPVLDPRTASGVAAHHARPSAPAIMPANLGFGVGTLDQNQESIADARVVIQELKGRIGRLRDKNEHLRNEVEAVKAKYRELKRKRTRT
jgi:FkbM family methyltransferase